MTRKQKDFERLAEVKNWILPVLKVFQKDIDGFNNMRFIDAMRNLGFRTKKSSGIGGKYIFIHSEKKVVVKQPACEREYVPSRAVATEFVDMDDCLPIFIQPIVDTDRKAVSRALRILEKCNFSQRGSDFHTGNIGIYCRKAVVFDW